MPTQLEVDLLGGESASGAVSAPDLLGAMDRPQGQGVAYHSRRLIKTHGDP